MNEHLLAGIIREYCDAVPELCTDAALLETAMYLEDTFGISMSDGEIRKEYLGSFPGIVAFVAMKLHLKANACVASAE